MKLNEAWNYIEMLKNNKIQVQWRESGGNKKEKKKKKGVTSKLLAIQRNRTTSNRKGDG